MAPAFDFDGSLVVGELNHTAGWSDWTFVPSSSLGDGTSEPLSLSTRRANLVQNDQFLEKCGELQTEGVPEDITLVGPWTILGDSTSIIQHPHHGWNVVLGAISQTVPTYSGLPHTLKFNAKIYGNCDPAAAILVSLLPSSSESNVFHTHSNDGLWTAEELRFSAVGETVNITFANIGSVRSNCSVAISNVEVGLEDDYLVFMAAYKLWTRVLLLYALVSIFGVLAFAILVMHIVGSLRTRKLK